MVDLVRKVTNVTSDAFTINEVASYLIYLEEDFYNIFGIDSSVLHSLIAKSLHDPASEYYAPNLFFLEDKLLGFYISNHTNKILQKRTHDLRNLIKASGRCFSRKDFESFASSNLSQFNGVYLSKICVAPEFRNTGIGKQILCDFIESSRSDFSRAVLHVHKDNLKAKHFYLANGFVYLDTVFGCSNYDFMEYIF